MTEHGALPTAKEIGPDRRSRRFGARMAIPTFAALFLVGVLVAVNRDSGTTRLAVQRPADNPVTLPEPDPVTTITTVETTVPPVTTPPTTLPATTVPPAPQPLRLEGHDGSLRVTADIDNAAPQAGKVVRVNLKIVYTGVMGFAVYFGNNSNYEFLRALNVPCKGTTTVNPKPDKETSKTFLNAYRAPGDYSIKIVAYSAEDCYDGNSVELTGTVAVGPGRLLSNGPLAPVVTDIYTFDTPPPGPNMVTLDFNGFDRDGFPSGATVKWGDGTTETKHNQFDCVDRGALEWPDGPLGEFTLQHTYGRSGHFDVEVTVTSSGCDGRDKQIATKRLTVTAAA